jgi:hypothetical protein
MKLFILLLQLSSLPPLARSEPREPREINPPVCNQSLVSQCIQKHQAAAALVRSWLSAHENKLRAIEGELASLNRSLSSIFAEKSSVLSDASRLRAELSFLRAKAIEAPPGLLGGKISLENFFHLHPLHRAWRERYPEERAQKLTDSLAETGKKEADLNDRATRLGTEKEKLDNDFQSVLSQKNSWLGEARGYDGMCNGGCREQLCAPRN